MEKRIQILANNDGTFVFINLPLLYQGADGNNYVDVIYNFPISNPREYVPEILFRRSDGKATGYLPLTFTELSDGNVWTKKLDSSWYLEKAGPLSMVVRLKKTDNTVTSIYNTIQPVVDVIATDDLFTSASLLPSAYDTINQNIANLNQEVFELRESNPVTDINTDDVDDMQFKYSTLNGDEHLVTLSLPEGLITDEEAEQKIENKFTNVDPVTRIIETSNQDMKFKYQDYTGNEYTVDIKLPNNVADTDYVDSNINIVNDEITTINNKLTDVVVYDKLERTNEPIISVTSAQLDGNNRNIVDTYATKNELSDYMTNSEARVLLDDIIDEFNVIETDFYDFENEFNIFADNTPIKKVNSTDEMIGDHFLYTINDSTESALYYTQDIILSQEITKSDQNVQNNVAFNNLYIDSSILESTSFTPNFNGNLGTMKWDGQTGSSTFSMVTDASGKITSLKVGWNPIFINGGALQTPTFEAKNIIISATNTTEFDKIKPYLFVGLITNTKGVVTKETANRDYVDGELQKVNNKFISLLKCAVMTANVTLAPNEWTYVTIPTAHKTKALVRACATTDKYLLTTINGGNVDNQGNTTNNECVILYNPNQEETISITQIRLYYIGA